MTQLSKLSYSVTLAIPRKTLNCFQFHLPPTYDTTFMAFAFASTGTIIASIRELKSDKLSKAARQRDGGVGTPIALNRILFTNKEVKKNGIAQLKADDYRAKHIRDVLQLPPYGGVIRAGVINNFLADDAPVEIHADHSMTVTISKGRKQKLPPTPAVSLILAVPRPKVLVRLLPQIVAIGVRDIVLCNAFKVEKCYFDSKIVTSHVERNQLIVEGLSQSGVDARMPTISVARRLKAFLEDDFPVIAPDTAHKFIAHPDSESSLLEMLPNLIKFQQQKSTRSHVTIAVGPEGGWMPRETSMFEEMFGFQRVSIGDRILRTDAAVLILLGMINQMTTMLHGLDSNVEESGSTLSANVYRPNSQG